MRDFDWLKNRFEYIWQYHFSDVPRENKVLITFQGKWKNKFGHIKVLKNKNTWIAVNKLFQDERVPEYIIDLTIAHEIVHYSHGFHSPLERKYTHPHKGGVVDKELKKRGFLEELKKEKKWIKEEWLKIYSSYFPEKKKRIRWFF
ncbi:MAG: hypothetical protein HYS32_02995 [Candidatus Woesearchaeota archaeon]|nr:MAG: hypothetical protein HYS32_02995 [Candidatus Woesearchaeota archaeon]